MVRQWSNQIANELKEVQLDDARLVKRCQKLASALSQQTDASIPRACGSWKETKGAYRFFSHPGVKRGAILAAHRQQTLERMNQESEVLVIQDTTYVNLTGHEAMKGLGPITMRKTSRGLVVHHALAVSGSGQTLGLLDQRVWARPLEGVQSHQQTTRQRQERERESQRWGRVLKTISRMRPRTVIHVADREADLYELLESLVGRQERFVIRSNANRRIRAPKAALLEQALRQSPDVGTLEIRVPARAGQPARQALLTLRARTVKLRWPYQLLGRHQDVMVNVVEAIERHAPKGKTPLDWRLLTSESIDTLDACLRVIRLYSQRWTIEEFHKGLKTGCRIEERRLETPKRFEVFLALASVISSMLLRLRDAAREASDRPAIGFFSAAQLALLHSKFPRLVGRQPTLRQALRAMAQMGGFLGRKGDGDPGWITLWHGLKELLQMEEAFHIAKSILFARRPIPTCG